MDADELRPAHVEGEAGHHVDRVGAADTDRDHAEPARVRRVAVGADHHPARERVVLEHDLVDDPRSGLPEADAVSRRDGAQEVVDLVVHGQRDLEVDARAFLRLDQVIAVDRRRCGDFVEARGHELEQRHLRGGVLHRDAVGAEVGVGAPAFELLGLGIAEVVHQDLLGKGEGTAEAPTPDGSAVGEGRIHAPHQLDRRLRSHSHVWPPFSARRLLTRFSM